LAKGLGELLVKENLIGIDQLEKAKKEQKSNGGRLSSSLVKLGYIDDKQLADFLAKQYNIPSVDLDAFQIDPEAIKLVPKKICEKYKVIPVNKSGDTLVLAMADPSNVYIKDDLFHITRCKITAVVAPEHSIEIAIDRYYSSKTKFESIMTEMEKETTSVDIDVGTASVILDGDSDDSPVVKFVNVILTEAVKRKASDIHIEPYEKNFRVRMRVDGSLYEQIQPPAGIAGAIASRIKVMSKLDISEKRRPQDGRLKIKTKDNKEVDFRVSILPTLFGEKVVMRILDKSNLQLDLTKLGFEADDLVKFQKALYKPNGILLITGPTGSGKTTTIYSALAELNQPDVNISTAEDPVEFNLEGINQVQMNKEIDLTFASALRSFLRQDPDIIMVGEIRDYETAEIAFKAALTGHLVVSTLHTNDAPATINRLINMGIEPFLVTSAVNLVVAQRLVKKICTYCKGPTHIDTNTLLDLGFKEEEIGTFQPMKGEGCERCGDKGYSGRISIYEILEFNDELKTLIFAKADPMLIKKAAVRNGMKTLRRSALNKMRDGITTIEEVLAVTAKDDAVVL
jgi:type IV pilus assembly protein PilB